MRKFVIGASIALMGMSASPSLAHGVDGAGRFLVNHADLASYYNEVPANTNILFLTVPVGRRFILTALICSGSTSYDTTIWIKEEETVKTRLLIRSQQSRDSPVVTPDFATGIPFEPGSSVHVESTRVDRVTLIGYYADLP